jgi:predicted SAM-dependent methyltransferase
MKLHIGCGSVAIPGYINVDIRYLPNVDVVDNAKYLKKFVSEDVSVIYACHVLEHFSRWEVQHILKRWYDILAFDGILTISVPDFGAVVQQYIKNQNVPELIGFLYGGQDYDENFHRYCWDFNSLKNDLEAIGFKKINRYEWEKSDLKDFDDYSKAYLPHMDKENGRLMSLNITAVKER